MKVVTRIAPSPTGYVHFGLARTALFNYLYAKKHGGEFIVRVEDTDTARNKPEYEADILEQLRWLNLTGDRQYRQSECVERHKECLKQLIDAGKAYVSKEPAKDDATREVEVVRLKNPGERVTFTDLIRGEISFDTTELKDFVIARSIRDPLYHFAVVVDDHDEGVTHVLRGDDHISNTPRQILILKALGFEIPAYAHLPLILMPDKSKMSKRRHETSVKHYREAGILHEALINYIALLGWTPPSGKEILSMDEMITEFDLMDLHKNGAVFDIEKLRWFNKEYLSRLPVEIFSEQALRIFQEAVAERALPWDEKIGTILVSTVVKERIHTWYDIRTLTHEGEFDYFFKDPEPHADHISQKGSERAPSARGSGGPRELAAMHLNKVCGMLTALPESDFKTSEEVKAALWDYATETGRGEVLWPLRFALSGRAKSPDPFVIASIVGKETSLRRIQEAIKLLGM
ncbi:MAG: glutamate--tRNA ligase family protein, partial [bacterium]|nr:glutamate--tRNA ligase family protein [bacterium]